jgi:hypothetical protein
MILEFREPDYSITEDFHDWLNDERDRLLEEEKKRQQERLEAYRRTEKLIQEAHRERAKRQQQIERALAQSTKMVNNEVFQSINATMSGLAGTSKKAALIMLALQKGLSIGKVVASGADTIADIRNMQQGLIAESIASSFINPAKSAVLATQAALLEGNISAVRANTGKSIAKIAAVGLFEAGAIGLSGGGSGGGGGGSASGGDDPRGIIEREDREKRIQRITFNEMSSSISQSQKNKPVFVIEQRVKNKELAIVVREGEDAIRSSQRRIVTDA